MEELISTVLDGNIVSVGKFFVDVLKTPYFIREELFWQNFIVYLDGACPNELIKFSLDYENNIDIPECIQKRLITEAATSEDIDRIIEGADDDE